MARKPKAIDPDRQYKIMFSSRFEHANRIYVPRRGQTVRVKGSILVEIKDKIDGYEAV